MLPMHLYAKKKKKKKYEVDLKEYIRKILPYNISFPQEKFLGERALVKGSWREPLVKVYT